MRRRGLNVLCRYLSNNLQSFFAPELVPSLEFYLPADGSRTSACWSPISSHPSQQPLYLLVQVRLFPAYQPRSLGFFLDGCEWFKRGESFRGISLTHLKIGLSPPPSSWTIALHNFSILSSEDSTTALIALSCSPASVAE
jgi:hypothetical protein